jgi:hypothetical protein
MAGERNLAETLCYATEQDHVVLIKRLFPDRTNASPEALAAVMEAVREFPDSAVLRRLHEEIVLASERVE